MTKEYAIKLLKLAKAELEWDYPLDYQIALDMAIKALEQKPILDKIRAEIVENSIKDYEYHGYGTDELIIGTSEVLQIIDKYKAESEDMQ